MASRLYDPRDKTLLVISGGGCAHIENSLGCLKALIESGIKFDVAHGTSAGALVSSLLMSKNQNVNSVIDMIKETDFSEWIKIKPWQAIKSILGKSNYFADDTGLKYALEEHITKEGCDSTYVSVSVMTDDGKFSHAKVLPGTCYAVLASMSFQGVFPPVRIDGVLHADGGVNDNIPLPRYMDIPKYKHIYMLVAPKAKLVPGCKKWTFLDKLLNIIDHTMNREAAQIEQLHFEEAPNITIIKPDSYVESAKFLGWSDNFEQIEASYEMTKAILSSPKYPAVFPMLPN